MPTSLNNNRVDQIRRVGSPIIEIKAVTKFFTVKSQSVQVLHSINLNINRGEFVALFGPSGCGKSTLLHITLGLEKPTTGVVTYKGQDIYLLDEDERAKMRKRTIGMIYQQSNWIKSLSVLENVAFMGSLLGHTRQKSAILAQEQLSKVGMLEWADYRPTELSSGQQQKVSLARALLSNPDIIIADEPTGNLDYRSGVELMEQFSALAAAGKTILMVTHNIDNVDYTTQVVQMFDGKIVGVNKTKEEDVKQLKEQIITNISKAQSKSQTKVLENTPSSISILQNDFVKKRGVFSYLRSPITVLKYGKFLLREIVHMFTFSAYLLYYFVFRGLGVARDRIGRIIPLFRSGTSTVKERLVLIDSSIHESDLIEIAVKNMFAKRTRTLVTIGGMAIGICLIVFLISIGYGVEQLVISRVARLEETKQIDISPLVASNVLITDKTIADIRTLGFVSKVLPVIGIVGKVRSTGATTDVAVYGVSPDYLKESAIRPVYGAVFDAATSMKVTASKKDIDKTQLTKVAAEDVAPEKGKIVSAIQFTGKEEYLRVRESPDALSKLIGYTKVATGSGSLVWGETYEGDDTYGKVKPENSDKTYGYWIQSDFSLWQEKVCTSACAINEKYEPSLDAHSAQKKKQGYIAMLGLETDYVAPDTDKSTLVAKSKLPDPTIEATDQASLVDRQLKELTQVAAGANVTQVELAQDKSRQAYVNTTLLKLIGVEPKNAPGTKIELALIAANADRNQKFETNFLEYTISGVTSEGNAPILYTKIEDGLELNLQNYSQAKVVAYSQDSVPKIRKQIESMGYKTSSVVDTISQIEKLFASVRVLLGVLGVVALSVAALGMFNTLTVSMLERTHEVGMMKAVGMVSKEVKELFIAESMVIGMLGGLLGLVMGIVAGRLLSLTLSVISVSKGAGFIDVSFLPLNFIILIVMLSLVVGFVTGMYPASRATKISALDALRYE